MFEHALYYISYVLYAIFIYIILKHHLKCINAVTVMWIVKDCHTAVFRSKPDFKV